MQFPRLRSVSSRVLWLTLVNVGGPEASLPYSEDTGLCICSTETFQSEGPAAGDLHTCTSASAQAVFPTLGEGWDRAWTRVERWGRASGVFGEDERIVSDMEVVFFWTLKCDQKAKGGTIKESWHPENCPFSHLDGISGPRANEKGIRKQHRWK